MKLLLPLVLLLVFFHTSFAATTWQKTPLTSTFATSLKTTPWGILAGEQDTRLWLNPFNGMYISKDLGKSWNQLGLSGRGVTSIAGWSKEIYATTYYTVNGANGAFKSIDGGVTWTHICNNFSASVVAANKDYVFIGTYTNGLWVYSKATQTCGQRIGDGVLFGPQILALDVKDSKVIATTQGTTYSSTNNGDFPAIVSFFNSKTVSAAKFGSSIILACTSGNQGLYKSSDTLSTWTKIAIFGNHSCGGISFYNNIFYVSEETGTGIYSVFSSQDLGGTWQNTNLDIQNTDGNAKAIEWAFSKPENLFALVPSQGVYSYEIPEKVFDKNPFLRLPWNYSSDDELTDRINSFFDHEYPLLGYSTYPEPAETSQTTLNYLGIRGSQPSMYYSSHDGIDFDLAYGTPVLAAADGTAVYYYCTACGNTIKINHSNGFESIYMHLQKNGLITNSTTNNVTVKKGDQIGLVGLTGNTTGPHLHFGVMDDKNNDGNFNNDYPDGKVDPFGWQAYTTDPWSVYSWHDSTGQHTGTSSTYLWNIPTQQAFGFFAASDKSISLGNKVILIGKNSSQLNLSVFLQDYAKPVLEAAQNNLKYIPHTSFIIDALDNLDNKIDSFDSPVIIKINVGTDDLVNIVITSLKIYFFDDASLSWKPLDTTYDEPSHTLMASTTHFTRFAVFGELAQPIPQTQITVSGNQVEGWYTEFPTIALTNGSNTILYSLDNGDNWETYSVPFLINKEGLTNLLYKAFDANQTSEETREYLIKIDTKGLWKKTIKLVGGRFST
ncbi:MAG TPA: M23 family metallopeptidase [Candidatus Saccharimonadales bacterium]|nr:M23 family metallopeptidase [Candidatus Saccharimonadales bacterium]